MVLFSVLVLQAIGEEPRPSLYKYNQNFKLKTFPFQINPLPHHFLKPLLG
jgi:hypothetical protein